MTAIAEINLYSLLRVHPMRLLRSKNIFQQLLFFFFRISQRVLDDLKKDLEKFNIEVHIDIIGGRNPLKDMNPKTNVCCRYLSVNQL